MIKFDFFKPRRLTTQLLVWLLVVSLCPFGIMSYIIYRIAEDTIHQDVLANLSAIRDIRAQKMQAYMFERKRDVTTLSHIPDIADAISTLRRVVKTHGIDSPEYRAVDESFRPRLTYLMSTGYVNLLLVSSDGEVVFAVNKTDHLGSNRVTGPHKDCVVARTADRVQLLLAVYISDFEYDQDSDRPAAFIGAPVVTGDGTIAGAILLQLSNQEISDLVQDYTGLGQTGEVVLAVQKDQEAVFIAPLRHDPDAAFTRRVSIGSSEALPIQKAVQGYMGAGYSVDYRGKEILAAWRNLSSLRWGMVVKIDENEAFHSIDFLRRFSLWIALVIIVLVGIITPIISRSISGPVVSLTRVTQEIAAGDLTKRVEVRTRNEIGTLADSFNTMADELQQVRDKLEERVKERTAELHTANRSLQEEVTERKRAEAVLANQSVELQRSNADLEQFAYVASHDLQEPLRMITAYLGLLRNRYADRLDTNAHEFIAYAVDGATRMSQLINDILAYSRVGSQGKSFDRTDCEAVIARVILNLQSVIEEKDIIVTHDALPTVMADDVQLGQVFQNLIGNAAKFHGARRPEIHVGAEYSGAAWVFSVRDNGIGMADKDIDRIFDIFQRLHDGEEYPGTGIGLAMCKKIVERHGGWIRVESKLGEGTTFFFAIPDTGELTT